jgi:hypothetical protein
MYWLPSIVRIVISTILRWSGLEENLERQKMCSWLWWLNLLGNVHLEDQEGCEKITAWEWTGMAPVFAHHAIWTVYMTCSKTRAVAQLFEQQWELNRRGCRDDTAEHLNLTYLVSHQYTINVSTVGVHICGPISCETVWQETKEGTGYRKK